MLEKIIKNLSGKSAVCILSVVLSSLSASSCAIYVPMNKETARKAEQLPEYFKKKVYSARTDFAAKELIENNNDYDEYRISLFSGNKKRTSFESIESKVCEKKDKWVVMYPILGGEDLLLVGYIARNVFAPEGINSAIVVRKDILLNDEGLQRPLKSPNPDVVDFEDYQYDSVKDGIRIINYLQSNGMKKFGLMGISLGGMQVAGLAPYLPDSKINILVMAGGDIGEIILNSTEGPVQAYKKYLVDLYGDEHEARIKLAEIKTDPLNFARYIDTDKVRMVITTKDTVVPSRCQLWLYSSLGRPTALFVPSNHYTLALHYFCVKNFIVSEIKGAFEEREKDSVTKK